MLILPSIKMPPLRTVRARLVVLNTLPILPLEFCTLEKGKRIRTNRRVVSKTSALET